MTSPLARCRSSSGLPIQTIAPRLPGQGYLCLLVLPSKSMSPSTKGTSLACRHVYHAPPVTHGPPLPSPCVPDCGRRPSTSAYGPIYATRTDHASSGLTGPGNAAFKDLHALPMVLSRGLTPAARIQRTQAQLLKVGSGLEVAFSCGCFLPSLLSHGVVALLISGKPDPTDSARLSRWVVTSEERDFHPSSGPFRAWLLLLPMPATFSHGLLLQ